MNWQQILAIIAGALAILVLVGLVAAEVALAVAVLLLAVIATVPG